MPANTEPIQTITILDTTDHRVTRYIINKLDANITIEECIENEKSEVNLPIHELLHIVETYMQEC